MVVEYELVYTTLRFTARCESCDGTIAFGVADASETPLSGVALLAPALSKLVFRLVLARRQIDGFSADLFAPARIA